MNLRQHTILTMVACLLALPSFAQESATQPAERRVWLRVTGERVNVRTRPDANSRIVARMMQDDVLIGVGSSYGWRRIVPPDGTYCLVASSYIDRIENNRGVVEVDTSLRVRFGSDVQRRDPLQSEVCDRLQPDETVQIVGEYNEEWLKIKPTERVRYYISGDFVQEISETDARRLLAQAPQRSSAATTQPASRWARRLADLEQQVQQEEQKDALAQDWTQIRSDMRVVALQRTDEGTAKLAEAWVQRLTERMAAQDALRQARRIAATTQPAGPPEKVGQAEPERPRRKLGPTKFDARGILRPSFAFPTGPYGLRYKLQDPFSREVVAYVEVPPPLRDGIRDNLGRYVGVVGKETPIAGVEVPFYVVEQLTVLNPARGGTSGSEDD